MLRSCVARTIWVLSCNLDIWSITGYQVEAINASDWWIPIEVSTYTQTSLRYSITCWDTTTQVAKFLLIPLFVPWKIMFPTGANIVMREHVAFRGCEVHPYISATFSYHQNRAFNLFRSLVRSKISFAHIESNRSLSEQISVALIPHDAMAIFTVMSLTNVRRKRGDVSLDDHGFPWRPLTDNSISMVSTLAFPIDKVGEKSISPWVIVHCEAAP